MKQLSKLELRLICAALARMTPDERWGPEPINALHQKAANELIDRWDNELRDEKLEKK